MVRSAAIVGVLLGVTACTNPTSPSGPRCLSGCIDGHGQATTGGGVPPAQPTPQFTVIISGHPDNPLTQGHQAVFYSAASNAVGEVIYHWRFADEQGGPAPVEVETSRPWVFQTFEALGYVTITLSGHDAQSTAPETVLLLQVLPPCHDVFGRTCVVPSIE